MKHKTCFKCRRILPLDAFYKHNQMADGHLGKCKDCNKKDVMENRIKRVEYYRDYDRKRSKTTKRKDLDGSRHKAFIEKNPLANIAHSATSRAIRTGVIQRPSRCDRCQKECKPDAHHDFYTRPLDILWLCDICHCQRHKELGRLGHHSPRKPRFKSYTTRELLHP